jgi:Pyridoxamine 5'-phosphate oxidase
VYRHELVRTAVRVDAEHPANTDLVLDLDPPDAVPTTTSNPCTVPRRPRRMIVARYSPSHHRTETMSVTSCRMTAMTSWAHVASSAPELADTVRRTFAIRQHATMATVRRDGSPRISGTEIDFDDDGEIYLGMMPGARRVEDLRHDPRVAIHCPTEDIPEDDPAS